MGFRVAHTTETIDVFWDPSKHENEFPHSIQRGVTPRRHTDSFICPAVTRRFVGLKGVSNPHQKPVCVMAELVHRFCPANGSVLDLTCGSGTTAMVSRLGGKWSTISYYLFDVEPAQVELARRRYQRGEPVDTFTSPALPPLALGVEEQLTVAIKKRQPEVCRGFVFGLG